MEPARRQPHAAPVAHPGRAAALPLFLPQESEPGPKTPADPAGPLQLQCACGRVLPLGLDPLVCVCGRELGRREAGRLVLGAPRPFAGESAGLAPPALLEQAERVGWQAALARQAPQLAESIASPRAAVFHELLPVPPGARILDIGAGWGGIAAALAGYYQVVALEGDPWRARFAALRRIQDELRRLTVVQADLNAAQFAPGQFDAIVLNAVLEWVPLGERAATPWQVQRAFLGRLREWLAPGGVIYLAVENRFGGARWRGQLDHSGLPFTALLPRPLARSVCRHSRRYRARFDQPYRTYTYSWRGYQRLFAEAGLRVQQAWVAPRGRQAPEELLPFNREALAFHLRQAAPARGLAEHLRRGLRQWSARPGCWRALGSNFVFLLAAPGAGDRRHG